MGQSHSRLRERVSLALQARGWPVIPYPSNGLTGPSVSDILACGPEGVFIAVECKTESDKPNPNNPRWIKQQRFLQKIQEAGGIAVWGYTSQEILSKIDQGIEERG